MRNLELHRLHEGDARTVAANLRPGSISVTVTSPPYWNLKDYGVTNQIGWGQSYADYINDLISIFRHIHTATRDYGTLWIVLDTFRVQGNVRILPFDLARKLSDEVGWLLQDVVIWDKGKTLPWSRRGQLRNRFEYVLCFSTAVRAFVAHEWSTRASQLMTLEDKRKALRTQILKLRIVKYPKALIKALRRHRTLRLPRFRGVCRAGGGAAWP